MKVVGYDPHDGHADVDALEGDRHDGPHRGAGRQDHVIIAVYDAQADATQRDERRKEHVLVDVRQPAISEPGQPREAVAGAGCSEGGRGVSTTKAMLAKGGLGQAYYLGPSVEHGLGCHQRTCSDFRSAEHHFGPFTMALPRE